MVATTVSTAQGPVEYCDSGSGLPILYFHGTGITSEVIPTLEAPLLADGFRLVVPNRPGYGRTPLLPDSSTVGCANRAAALLDQLGIDRISVMGSSGGAAFALSFAATHPSRTLSLVLLCPQVHRWDARQWMPVASKWTLPLLQNRLLRKVMLQGYRIQISNMSPRAFLKLESGERFPDVANDPAALQFCQSTSQEMNRAIRSAGFDNDMTVFLSEDILPDPRALQAPTLIIHDPQDPIAPVAHVDWLTTVVPTCERMAVHVAGHLVWIGPEAARMHASRVAFVKKHLHEPGRDSPGRPAASRRFDA